MSQSVFAEDLFEKFFVLSQRKSLPIQHQDLSPMINFYQRFTDGDQLTQNQANYVLKLLDKYKVMSANAGFDYVSDLPKIVWKQPFRILDTSKKIYIEKNKNGVLEICLKFPFQLKKEFEEVVDNHGPGSHKINYWDNEEKVRRLDFYSYNLVTLHDFAIKHGFEIDETFMTALAEVEEIWENSESIVNHCEVVDNEILLLNASEEITQYWREHSTGKYESDILLAKSMGFPFKGNPKTLVEKIASSTENSFWVKSNQDLFSLYKSVNGKVCVILDRTSNTLSWLQNFIADSDNYGIDRDDIKVCFRDNKDSKTGLNEWIKLAGVGGKVETGKILIFEFKPAKWLFKEPNDVKILVTNILYPSTNQLTKDWLASHSCVIYLGDIKPSEQRGQKIVEL